MWVFEMTKTGFSDRSKAIQTALHSFIGQYERQKNDVQNGAGTINLLYDNHIFDQDTL
jgi:metal-responsive CopG/Arc/MetJ family transcriptional regulator